MMGGSFSGSTLSRYTGKWLIGVGVFELLLAAGFVAGALLVPGGGFGLILTAAILGVVGLGLLVFGIRSRAKAAEADRIEATGLVGTGTITGMTQTGMFLNENPQIRLQMRIEVQGRAPYVVEHAEFIPLMLLSRVGMGAVLPVKVDRDDPNEVVVEWSGQVSDPSAWGVGAPAWGEQGVAGAQGMTAAAGMPGGVGATAGGAGPETLGQIQAAMQASGVEAATPFAQAGQGQYSIAQLREHLRQNGISGTAHIDEVQDTGQVVGTDRLMTMQATVTIPGRPPITGPTSAAMVPISAAPKVIQGATVPVKVDPTNSDLMMFEWEKL
jgi:hypothetical protein